MYTHYGAERVLPPSDFAVYTNEQFGFTANLVDDTNNGFAFALPFASGINLERETMRIRAIDFAMHLSGRVLGASSNLAAYISMLDEEFSAGMDALADADDEEMRAHFDGPIQFGKSGNEIADAAGGATAVTQIQTIEPLMVRYYPWQSTIDMLTPIYIQLRKNNHSVTVAAETLPVGTGNFNDNETVTIKPIYVTRALSADERSMRNNQFQWMRLNS